MSRNWKKEFEWFHSHPELGFQEVTTTYRIKEILKEEGIEEITIPLETGALAVIRGEKPGNNRLLRADIDALPIKEESGVTYASVNEGVMHACGHDVHIVNALMVAGRLNSIKSDVEGNVFILFQPGEEVFDGAASVIRTGITKDIDEFYAFHVDPEADTGTIELKQGGITSSVDKFYIKVEGIGAHAAMPHQGRNPIHVLTDLVGWLDSYSDTKIDAFTPHVITVTHICAGTTWNVIPTFGELEGTVRTLDENVRNLIHEEIDNAIHAFEILHGVKITLEWTEGPHVAVNDEELYFKAKKVAGENDFITKAPEDIMIGDDFGDYAPLGSGKKSLYIRIGSGIGYTYHHPKFYANPDILKDSSSFLFELLKK